MPIIRTLYLSTMLLIFIFVIYIQSVYATVDPGNNDSFLNSTTSPKPDNYAIKVGEGNNSISVTRYFPPYVEITMGDSITWYNGVDVPNPHTVTFVRDLDNIEKIGVPFYVPNNTKFIPVLDNLGAPLKEVTSNGTQIVMMLNARALTPTIITSDDKVINLNKDPVYGFEGSEKYINSGPLLSLDKEQSFDYFFNSSFTIVFNKPGLFEYSCLFHPWMVGKILVK
ncbi:cupredoxin domain-containing protein [Candidatus Nitrosocosmicus hydrocola]|uniref:cupredoxin domain-containing protein n=1 Tax=Candidatus Nitrosocosmicus hydrocola TaxID=1826872 RepID=UPI0011E5E538|nr:hypothetical protein [Candidatus Nitrosocosmicus hydrocola]